VTAGSTVNCSTAPDWSNNFSQCLYDWQGLEAGALALAAALVGAFVLQRQIRQQRVHRADEISRRHNAARLTLPLALSAISELVQRIANQVGDEFESFGPDGARTIKAVLDDAVGWDGFEPIALPNEVLISLEKFVASLSREQDIRHVAELVGSIQILLARYNGFDFKQAAAQQNLVGLLLDAAKVRLLNDKIYNYARFVDESSFGIVGVIAPGIAWDEIHGKAQGLLFNRQRPDVLFPGLRERVDGYKKSNISPWNEKFEA